MVTGSAEDAAQGAVTEVELSTTPRAPRMDGTSVGYVVLRWRERPVGRLVLGAPVGDEAFRKLAMEAAAPGIAALEAEGPGLGEGPSPEQFSVVIATRNRPDDLRRSLDALRGLDPPPGEIVVVDSASREAGEVAEVTRRAGARGIRLDEPGLSRARNAGAAAARGEILAFLDDDCRVDPGWLAGLRRGFRDGTVRAVAGLLLPASLETRAQVRFLRYTHMDRRGFVPRRFHRDVRESRHWPLDVWRIGSGGNLAVRRAGFEQLGGFDRGLGLGTPARGGEDLFLLWRLIGAGDEVAYRPDALAWHRHHRTTGALGEMLYGYGTGHAAYLRAVLAAGAPRGRVRWYKLSYYADRLRRLGRSVAGRSGYPPSLVMREIAGSLAGGRGSAR